ncbi:MAG: cyclic nucleotide-binding domain-containing protein [Solirubrobacteraceae bacterium]
MQTLEELVSSARIFEGLGGSHLELIAGCGRNIHVDAGVLLLREGDPADRFYLIRRGALVLEVHAPGRPGLPIETVHAGDVIGWSWLFAPYRWQLDGRTTEACELIAFDGACLRAKCEADHELGYQLMKRFAEKLVARLQATRLQLLDVYGDATART